MRDTEPLTEVLRTSAGQDELASRQRGLSQRHRTLLLLADGKRDLATVLSMAQSVGAERSHFDDLIRLGLLDLQVPMIEVAPPEPEEIQAAPALEPLEVDTVAPPITVHPPAPPPSARRPRPLERARALLLEALSDYAPVSGSLLARRIRRAESAKEIEAMLDEVETKMARKGTLVQASQVVRRARELLSREG